MDRIDNGVGSFVMGMFRYSSFVGTTNQIAKPARTNGTPLGKPCSSMLRPENFLSGSCMRRRSPTNRTETMAVPNEDSSEAKLPYRPKDNSSFTGAAFRGSGLFFGSSLFGMGRNVIKRAA